MWMLPVRPRPESRYSTRPGRNADAVAEMTVALLMALGRHVIPGHRDMVNGTVYGETLPYQRYRAWQVAGQTIGLVGLGAVGSRREVAFRGARYDRDRRRSFRPTMQPTNSMTSWRRADVVSTHAAVTPDTFGMMNAAKFERMKPGACYINSARAGLHDVGSLVEALQSGHLGGAALDHVDGESLPSGHPLLSMDNVVLTPHIGGATYDVETPAERDDRRRHQGRPRR